MADLQHEPLDGVSLLDSGPILGEGPVHRGRAPLHRRIGREGARIHEQVEDPLFVIAEVVLGVWSLGVGLKLFKLGKAGDIAD